MKNVLLIIISVFMFAGCATYHITDDNFDKNKKPANEIVLSIASIIPGLPQILLDETTEGLIILGVWGLASAFIGTDFALNWDEISSNPQYISFPLVFGALCYTASYSYSISDWIFSQEIQIKEYRSILLSDEYDKKTVQDILTGRVRVRMTKEMVIESIGEPKDINTTVSALGIREQWVYGNGFYVYFTDGKVTTIQDF